jgi:hypothetical protein
MSVTGILFAFVVLKNLSIHLIKRRTTIKLFIHLIFLRGWIIYFNEMTKTDRNRKLGLIKRVNTACTVCKWNNKINIINIHQRLILGVKDALGFMS